jgi:hypothetical protein
VNEVNSDWNFRKQCVGDQVSEDLYGTVKLANSSPRPLFLLWKQVGTACYSVLLEDTENRALCIHFLLSFPQILADHFRNPLIAGQPKEVWRFFSLLALSIRTSSLYSLRM